MPYLAIIVIDWPDQIVRLQTRLSNHTGYDHT